MQLQSRSSRALSDALQTAAKCIGSKNSMSILDNVLLSRRHDGQFLFTAATADSQLTIPAPLALIDGKFDSPVALPVGGIVSYLSTLPDCAVNLTINDNNALILDYCTGSDDHVTKGRVSLVCHDGAEFPNISNVAMESPTRISLPASLFIKAIDDAKVFSATDELRTVLCTLCIDIAEDTSECYLVSTNGVILIKHTCTNNAETGGHPFFCGGEPRKFIIHNRFFKTLSAFSACDTIDIQTDGNSIFFTSGDIEFICKSIEGNYPKYNAVIPKNNPYYLSVNKKEILNVIKRVSIFGSEASKLIKVSKEGMFLNISAQDIDLACGAEDQVLVLDSQCTEGFSIGFNSQNFINAINAIPSEKIRINLTSHSIAATITPDVPNPTTLALSMPTLLN